MTIRARGRAPPCVARDSNGRRSGPPRRLAGGNSALRDTGGSKSEQGMAGAIARRAGRSVGAPQLWVPHRGCPSPDPSVPIANSSRSAPCGPRRAQRGPRRSRRAGSARARGHGGTRPRSDHGSVHGSKTDQAGSDLAFKLAMWQLYWHPSRLWVCQVSRPVRAKVPANALDIAAVGTGELTSSAAAADPCHIPQQLHPACFHPSGVCQYRSILLARASA